MTAKETYQAVVVGAGAGGGCVAKTLAAAGVQTLLLERGEWSKTDVYGEDDLSSQRSPWLTLGPGPGGARTCRQHFHDNGSLSPARLSARQQNLPGFPASLRFHFPDP